MNFEVDLLGLPCVPNRPLFEKYVFFKQLLLVIFCNTPPGIKASFQTEGGWMEDGRTDRPGS